LSSLFDWKNLKVCEDLFKAPERHSQAGKRCWSPCLQLWFVRIQGSQPKEPFQDRGLVKAVPRFRATSWKDFVAETQKPDSWGPKLDLLPRVACDGLFCCSFSKITCRQIGGQERRCDELSLPELPVLLLDAIKKMVVCVQAVVRLASFL
jgi:hypothetical protein